MPKTSHGRKSTPPPQPSLRKGSGSQYVFETLRRKILTLDLAPGTHLEEAKLVEMFGVSRTPVREALIRLGSERLVVLLSNRSATVAPLELSDFRQYFEALDLAQRATSRWAAERRTEEQLKEIERHMEAFEAAAAATSSDMMMEANRDYHLAIATAAENEYLHESCMRVFNQGLRISRIALTYDSYPDKTLDDHIARIVEEHRRLFTYIAQRNAEAAEVLAGEHAALARARVIENMTTVLSPKVQVSPAQTFP